MKIKLNSIFNIHFNFADRTLEFTMNRIFPFLFIGILFTLSCNNKQVSQKSGRVLFQLKLYDSAKQEYRVFPKIFPENKVWYVDSFFIEEIPLINIEVTDGQQETKSKVMHYTFMDLRTRKCYDYRTFTDTAKIIKQYVIPDSAAIPYGSVYVLNKDVPKSGPAIDLPDTLIDNVNYQRTLFTTNSPTRETPDILAYFRCDKKGSIITFFRKYNHKDGCPMVKFIELPWKNNPLPLMIDTRYVSDRLGSEEMKVFDAWKKNASQN